MSKCRRVNVVISLIIFHVFSVKLYEGSYGTITGHDQENFLNNFFSNYSQRFEPVISVGYGKGQKMKNIIPGCDDDDVIR